MKEMYKGKVNSPATQLVEAIDLQVKNIKVKDASVLPEGPNIAVIGTDGNAETIKYESINDNILVGCVRGFQGEIRAWEKDTPIARNFTEYDLNSLQENILELDKKELKDFQDDENHRTVSDDEKNKWNNPPNPDLSGYATKNEIDKKQDIIKTSTHHNDSDLDTLESTGRNIISNGKLVTVDFKYSSSQDKIEAKTGISSALYFKGSRLLAVPSVSKENLDDITVPNNTFSSTNKALISTELLHNYNTVIQNQFKNIETSLNLSPYTQQDLEEAFK